MIITNVFELSKALVFLVLKTKKTACKDCFLK